MLLTFGRPTPKTMGPVVVQEKNKHSTTDELKVLIFFVMLFIYYSYESNSHTIMTTDKTDFLFNCLRHREGNLSLTESAVKHSLVRPRTPL